jgi:hypothetical protein
MTDDQFRILCNTYGFAPSRALRELLDAATAQAVMSEREQLAGAIDHQCRGMSDHFEVKWLRELATAIRAQYKKEPRQA